MEPRNYNDYSLQELYDLYRIMDNETNPEARIIYDQILLKEKEQRDPFKLAKLSERLGASILDGLIAGIPLLVIFLIIMFSYLGFENVMEFYQYNQILISLIMMAGVQIMYLSINGWLLYKNGQTVGKKIMGIKIVTTDNEIPSFFTVYVLRYLLVALLGAVPILGSIFTLIDTLFIFRKDRRCIHDLIAGTRVVAAE